MERIEIDTINRHEEKIFFMIMKNTLSHINFFFARLSSNLKYLKNIKMNTSYFFLNYLKILQETVLL